LNQEYQFYNVDMGGVGAGGEVPNPETGGFEDPWGLPAGPEEDPWASLNGLAAGPEESLID